MVYPKVCKRYWLYADYFAQPVYHKGLSLVVLVHDGDISRQGNPYQANISKTTSAPYAFPIARD